MRRHFTRGSRAIPQGTNSPKSPQIMQVSAFLYSLVTVEIHYQAIEFTIEIHYVDTNY
jgi:hypothetical protein